MALPDLISITPLTSPPRAMVTVPGSKSITNRALILAVLSTGEAELQGALWSEDTQVMVECLERLGVRVHVDKDPTEPANRHLRIRGSGRVIAPGGTATNPLELFVGNAGTAARFLTALVCLGQGAYRLSGVPRMHERPQAALFKALRQLGYRVDAPNDRLPAVIHGGGRREGACSVSIEQSSQFASALLLASHAGGWRVEIEGDNADESAYITLTRRMLSAFPFGGGLFKVEPDASSGSYFVGADLLFRLTQPELPRSFVQVRNWGVTDWQIDSRFSEYPGIARVKPGEQVAEVSRSTDLGDSIMTAIVLAPFLPGPMRFTNLGRLRVQECERVAALYTELTKCGARVVEEGDTLSVRPSRMHGAEIETYQDHRMAMCFALVGLNVPGILIRNPSCVKKTFPNFFQKIAAPPPAGLGVNIIEPSSGRLLSGAELHAD